MSGRIVTSLLLIGCISCACYALWRRSNNTIRVRSFWTAEGAWLIQHAPVVKFRRHVESVSKDTEEFLWRDVSLAPGLVHMRATLVDDRYFVWSTMAVVAHRKPDSMEGCRFRFQNGEKFVEISLIEDSGQLYSLRNSQTVELIPASREAVTAFLADWR